MNPPGQPGNALRRYFQRHPLVADSFRWVLPALLIGAVLRVLFTSYIPYAVWGPDSRSYYIFTHRLFYHSPDTGVLEDLDRPDHRPVCRLPDYSVERT
jgi:hypothetical protein